MNPLLTDKRKVLAIFGSPTARLSLAISWECSLAFHLSSLKSAGKSELTRNTINAVSRVDVLDQHNLVAGCTALAGYDG
jgi:hypothetical protein